VTNAWGGHTVLESELQYFLTFGTIWVRETATHILDIILTALEDAAAATVEARDSQILLVG